MTTLKRYYKATLNVFFSKINDDNKNYYNNYNNFVSNQNFITFHVKIVNFQVFLGF